MNIKYKTYKDIEHLKKVCISNNGKKVFIWDDCGIKIYNKIFYMFEYGNMEYNFKGNCYVTFRNEGHKGKHNRNNPFSNKDKFITIEYNLLKNEKENSNNIFNFVLLRESF